MKHSKAEPRLEEIPESECLELLARHSLGRVAIVIDGRPQIFPVNYGLRGKVLAFRTASGTKLAYAPTTPVASEIDQYDPSEHADWSVMVQRIARDVTESGDDFSWVARGVEAYPAAPGTKVHRIAIDPITITGPAVRGPGLTLACRSPLRLVPLEREVYRWRQPRESSRSWSGATRCPNGWKVLPAGSGSAADFGSAQTGPG